MWEYTDSDYYPDKSETQQIGILPDIEVKSTIQGIRQRRDEVLEAAIKYLNAEEVKWTCLNCWLCKI